MARELDTLNFSSAALSPGAVDKGDDKQPLTKSYSFTIAQRLPWSSLLEVAYVGNQSTNLLNTSGGQGPNVNLVPLGAMLSSNNGGVDPNSLYANNFRPIKAYSDINLATNNLYANYNSMQATWARTRGRYTLSLNYSFAKALGFVSPAYDSFNLANNYTVQSSNRTHIFNAAYSIELGNPAHNKIAGGFVNGWQVSGILQLESGANLTGIQGENFGLNLNSYKIPGTTFNVSNTSLLGTTDIALHPLVTCNPTSNLATQPVHQRKLLRHPDADRPERAYHLAGDLRAGIFQRRPGTFQELLDQGEDEAAVPGQRVQLPESPALVLQRRQPDSRLQRHYRDSQHADLRLRDAEAGPPHRATRGEVHLLRTVGRAAGPVPLRLTEPGLPVDTRLRIVSHILNAIASPVGLPDAGRVPPGADSGRRPDSV